MVLVNNICLFPVSATSVYVVNTKSGKFEIEKKLSVDDWSILHYYWQCHLVINKSDES